MLGQKQEGEMDAQADLDLTVIPMKHLYWHKWSLQAARTFV